MDIDSFTIYVCIDGTAEIAAEGGSERIARGEAILIPAEADSVKINGCCRLLEVYVK